MKPFGEDFYEVEQFGEGSTGYIEISKYLTADKDAVDEFRITNTGKKRCRGCQYERGVGLNVWWDKVSVENLVYQDRSLCQGCQANEDAIRCNINIMRKTLSCVKN